ncbi:MAG: hypothetical protein AAGG59_05505 [Bacteroidota bacterium]
MALEFSSNISIREADKDRFQLIHATQLYGTFFGIYAQMVCDKPSDGKTRLKEMNFVGINYKGPINLELCKQPGATDQILVVDKPRTKTTDDGGIEMDIWVRASTKNVETKFEVLTLDFQQFNLDEISDGNYLRVLRKLQRMSSNGTGSKNEAIVNGMFDSEYFVRDGLLIRPQGDISPVPGEVRKYVNSDFITTGESVEGNPFNRSAGPVGAATINCTPSNLKMFL